VSVLSLFTHLDVATVIGLVVSVVIPALSSLLSREHWDAAVTGVLTLLLSTADGFFTQWGAHPVDFQWKAAVGTAVVSYAIALATRFGVLKDTALDAKLLAVGSPPTGAAVSATPPAAPVVAEPASGGVVEADPMD